MKNPAGGILLACLAVLAAPGTAEAQAFPSRNIRFIGIATPGTTSDVIGRAVAEPLSRQLGRTIVVDQRGGAGGTLAAGMVARAEPDGHTLLLTTSAQSGMTWLYPGLTFDPVRDFAGISTLAELPSVIVVPPQRNWSSLKDLIAAARAKPGALNFGSGGVGSGTHLSSEMVMLAAGITANHVPFKGTSEVLVEIMAGRLDWIYVPMAGAVAMVKEGRLKALAVSSKARNAAMPDVPTMAEAGLPGGEYVFWVGLFAPRKTPRPAIDRLHQETGKVLGSPELRERFRGLGAEAFPMKPADLDAFLAADTATAGRIVKAANIKPQ